MGIFHINVVQSSADVVLLLHVRLYLQTTVGADGQGLVRKAHLIEICLCKVTADGAFDLAGIEQHVCAETAFEDIVVTSDVGLSATVLHVDGGCQVIKVPLAVLQGQNLGIGSQTATSRHEVCAIA